MEAALHEEGGDAFAALLERIDDVDSPFFWNGISLTPLEFMRHSEGRSVARLNLLLAHGARADVPGRYPLGAIGDYSFGDDEAEFTDIVRLLVAAGADIEGGAGSGSPLAVAVYGGSVVETRALLAAGANPDVSVKMGRPTKPVHQSLLRMAVMFPDVLPALLDYGATAQGSGALEHVTAQLAGDSGRDEDWDYFDEMRQSKRLLDTAQRRWPFRPPASGRTSAP